MGLYHAPGYSLFRGISSIANSRNVVDHRNELLDASRDIDAAGHPLHLIGGDVLCEILGAQDEGRRCVQNAYDEINEKLEEYRRYVAKERSVLDSLLDEL